MSENNQNKILKWVLGKDIKSNYVKSLSIAILIMVLTLIYCAYVYPLPFSMFEVQISQLGGEFNTQGYLVFATGFIITGILMLPHCLYFYGKIQPDLKLLSQICTLLLIIASLGIVGVGVFREDWLYYLHIVAAVMAFGGIALTALLLIPVMIKKYKIKTANANNRNSWNFKIIIGIYAIIIGVIIFGIFSSGIPILKEILAGTYVEHTFPPLWPITEWMVFFAAIIFLYGIFIATPSEKS